MKKDKTIKKLKKKIKKLGEAVNFIEEYADHTYATNYNAVEIICNYLGIEHEVDMDGLYVAGEKVSGEIFTKKEVEEMTKRNNWPISTGCQCKGAEISGYMHVSDSGFLTPNHPITTSTATSIGGHGAAKETFSAEDDDGMEEEDGK